MALLKPHDRQDNVSASERDSALRELGADRQQEAVVRADEILSCIKRGTTLPSTPCSKLR
jgi:hypothetical protein